MRFILTTILLLISTNLVFAANWYVRDAGGSIYGTSQGTNVCNGHTNAVYNSGTSPNCALRNIPLIMGYCTSSGAFCSSTGQWASGDIINIVGDSDISPGNQATFRIGQVSPDMPSCTSGIASDCVLGNIPAGSNSSNKTTIIGIGTRRPQIYATTNPWQLIYASNSHIALTNIELATHSSCGYNSPDSTCTNGEGNNRTTDGIVMGGDDIVLTDVWIHGMSRFGIVTTSVTNITFTRVWIIGNAFGGFSLGNNDASSGNGTLTWNQPIVEWNGCLENYPLTQGIDGSADHVKCYGQYTNGFGDGMGFGPAGNQNAGNWLIYGPGSISFNTQDGLDTLHGSGNGTIKIDKMRFEGNAGNQVKINAAVGSLTNSLVVGDCGWWYGSSNGSSFDLASNTTDNCRATGNPISYFTTAGAGTVDSFYNNTIISYGDAAFLQNNTCDSGTILNIKNNIVIGGYDWWKDTTWNGAGDNSLSTFLYNAGTLGDGQGCAFGTQTTNEDYNIVTGFKSNNVNCSGTHDKCGTSPGFVSGSFPVGTAGGSRTTFYTGLSGISLLPISNGSAAKGAGTTGLSYWNNSNDYYNVTRVNPPSMGGLEYSSCAASSYGCFYNSDCCGGSCTNNICGGSCSSNDLSCSTGSTCCSGTCVSSICTTACTSNSGSCSTGSTCCSGYCIGNTTCNSCIANGSSCTYNSDCCGGTCSSNVCGAPTIIFPKTSVLDTFNRSNSSGLGGNWTVQAGNFNIVSNYAIPTTSNSANRVYWSANSFSADEEVYATISNKGSNGDDLELYTRYNTTDQNYRLVYNPSGNSLDTYVFKTGIGNGSDGPNDNQLGTISQIVSSGDSIGMSVVGASINIYYKASGGSWVNKATYADSNVTAGGYIVMRSSGGSGTPDIHVINFGGGSIGVSNANLKCMLNGKVFLSGKTSY